MAGVLRSGLVKRVVTGYGPRRRSEAKFFEEIHEEIDFGDFGEKDDGDGGDEGHADQRNDQVRQLAEKTGAAFRSKGGLETRGVVGAGFGAVFRTGDFDHATVADRFVTSGAARRCDTVGMLDTNTGTHGVVFSCIARLCKEGKPGAA